MHCEGYFNKYYDFIIERLLISHKQDVDKFSFIHSNSSDNFLLEYFLKSFYEQLLSYLQTVFPKMLIKN